MMKILHTFLILCLVASVSLAQGTKEKVTFSSDDGIEITADKYQVNAEYPYILLFHQAGSSRGEFNDIAERFQKLRYNCLAVDLRSGDNSNFVKNETAQKANEQNTQVKFLDASKDIRASIDYVYGLNPKEVILLGSSYSASLVILEGKEHPYVKGVIAFSPGEYFGDDLRMEEAIDTFPKPLFVAVTQREEPYVKQMLSNVPQDGYTLFLPEKPGMHGARALWEDNPSKDEYWLALLLFINNLNK
ncbi:alpha/beta hydrolase [Bacteroidota bacterium]